MTKDEALDLALEALETLARYENPETRVQVRKSKDNGPIVTMYPHKVATDAITAIKQALAQPEERYTYGTPLLDAFTKNYEPAPLQEPVGFIESLKDAQPCCGQYETCYRACTPRGKFLGHRDAQRQWVGLTDEEKRQIFEREDYQGWLDYINAIEARLKELNT